MIESTREFEAESLFTDPALRNDSPLYSIAVDR